MVDRAALAKARAEGDVTGAEEILKDAYATDVRPMLAAWRTAKGLAAEPLKAYRASGLKEKDAAERARSTFEVVEINTRGGKLLFVIFNQRGVCRVSSASA